MHRNDLESDEYMIEIGFDFKSALEQSVAETTTTMVISAADWTRYISPLTGDFYCMLLSAEDREIVKCDRSLSVSPNLIVARGQEGTSARDWPRGTLIYHDVTAAALGEIEQAAVSREVDYNPNGALNSLFFGEKVYQSNLALWWKSVAEGTSVWRLIAGEIFIDDVGFSPDPGSYAQGQALTMSVLAAGASIYYTDDGSTPDENSTEYTAPVVMPTGTTTYKARGYGANRWEQPSENITSGEYIVSASNWLQVVSAKTNVTPYAMTTYKGELYHVNESQQLYRYDGDVAGTWTLVCGAPSTGFTNGYKARIVATSDHIYHGNTASLWRWGTGDGSWTQISTPYTNVTGLIAFKDTHIIHALRGAEPPDWSIQSYDINSPGFDQLSGSNYRYSYGSQQDNYYYLGGRALLVSEWTGSYCECAYVQSGLFYWIAGANTGGRDPVGVYCYSTGGTFDNGTPYFTDRDGVIWRIYTSSTGVAASSPLQGSETAMDSITASIGGINPRVFTLAAVPFTVTGALYSWAGSGAQISEEPDPPGELTGSDYLNRIWPFNDTIYATATDGTLYKWQGG